MIGYHHRNPYQGYPLLEQQDDVELVRIDPEKNVWRFYYLWLAPDFFCSVRLVRFWGRISTSGGQHRVEPFDDIEQARDALAKIVNQKLRRGYRYKGAL
ncbi:Msl9076 protein [Halorhodospira halochloris]|uniref:Msl9076 protein n=1 Tax=Halorhodospira halochloris TaxID=1052 RepID=A0A0X8XA02_HALHR|nr:WGR domain-containing protein [Halorhodospira halochloris]MBK1652981.1 hypothetical protein [Halorhodospira halochloris]BAU58114.1 Msl9076 protein [Halorhodospira halochloris]